MEKWVLHGRKPLVPFFGVHLIKRPEFIRSGLFSPIYFFHVGKGKLLVAPTGTSAIASSLGIVSEKSLSENSLKLRSSVGV